MTVKLRMRNPTEMSLLTSRIKRWDDNECMYVEWKLHKHTHTHTHTHTFVGMYEHKQNNLELNNPITKHAYTQVHTNTHTWNVHGYSSELYRMKSTQRT